MPSESVVLPVKVLLAVGAMTQVPAPIFCRLVTAAGVVLTGITAAMVLSAVLVPPRTKVCAPLTVLRIVPLYVSAPDPLALR